MQNPESLMVQRLQVSNEQNALALLRENGAQPSTCSCPGKGSSQCGAQMRARKKKAVKATLGGVRNGTVAKKSRFEQVIHFSFT